ncbi:MAG: hypothetical protein WBQ75_20275 [Acetobacteraceae bacterium]
MAAITPRVLLPGEQETVAATEHGDWAELSGKSDEERRVHAAFLRELLLGLPVVPEGDGARPCLVRLPGVRVRGARIEDELDLADYAGPVGGGLPGLALEDCDIGAKIDLTNTRLARLSLKGSRIGEVQMRGARLDGPFDFSAVRPASDAPDALAWIDAHDCVIRGEMLGDCAKLRAPPKREDVPPRQERYALDLSDSIVDGSLRLLGKVEAIGGVNVAGTRIRGDLYGTDARMEATEGDALNAQAARIDGLVVLAGLTGRGMIWLTRIRIGGALLMDRADLKNGRPEGRGDALVATGAEIGGAVQMRDGFMADGSVLLLGANIHGNLECDGAHFANRTQDGSGQALLAEGAEIGGDALLRDGFTAQGRVSLHGAKIRGNLECGGAHFANRTQDGSGQALLAEGAEIGGDALLSDGFTAQGRVSLHGAKIRGNLECDGAHFANCTQDGNGDALIAQSAEIGGDMLLRGFKSEGCVSVYGAKIGGDLACDGAHFANRIDDGSGDALVATNTEIRGDVLLCKGFRAEGGVSLHGAKIAGNLDCDGGHFANRTKNGKGRSLVAEGAEIIGAVLLRDGFTAEGRVVLLNAKMGSLSCRSATLCNSSPNKAAITLNLVNATIAGRARLEVVSIGRISLRGCRVGGNLNCAGGTFVTWSRSCRGAARRDSALDATNLTAGADVILDRVTVLGSLVFEHAEITGGLRWDGIHFPRSVEVRTPMAGNAKLSHENAAWSYSGRLDAATANPGASPLLRGTDADPATQIVLAHARIGAALQAHDLAAEVPLVIDLSAAHAYTLDDFKDGDTSSFPAGWGGDERDGRRVPRLDLDGFIYQRIEHFPSAPPSEGRRLWQWLFRLLRRIGVVQAPLARVLAPLLRPLRKTRIEKAARAWDRLHNWASGNEDIAGPRLAWLRRQHVARAGAFFPQPYRHLATVLRTQGHMEAARTVAIAEQDATPYGLCSRFPRFLFGRCFGYGLSPRLASRTLIVVLLIGTALVWAAWKQPWMGNHAAETSPLLVLTADREAALSAEQQLAGMRVDLGERRCGKHDIQPLFYAVDMMLPVIPLHQEDRCEVAARPGTEIWQIAWAVFSILGKIVTSLALITYSGVLKPKDD